MHKHLILVVIFSTTLTAFGQAGQTKSQEYAWLESHNTRTTQFRSEAKREVRAALSLSANLKKIEEALLKKYPANVASLAELEIDADRKIIQARKNFATVLIDQSAGVDRPFFSTDSLKPRSAVIMNLALSPNKKFLVIQLQLDGNIDVSRYVVYDLDGKKLSGNFDGLSYMLAPAWTSAEDMITMHPDSSPRLTSAMTVNLRTLKSQVTLNQNVHKFKDWLAVTSPADKKGRFTHTKTGQTFAVNTHVTTFNDVEETDTAFYYVLHEHNDGTIFRLPKKDETTPETFIPPRPGHWLSSMDLLDDKFLLVNYSRDSLVTLVLYDLTDGKKLSELSLPDNYDLAAAKAPVDGKLQLSAYNFLGNSFEVTWNLANPEESDLSGLPTTFQLGELELVSRLEQFKSHDGEDIPARLVYLKGTVFNGKNPAYLETYGAFNYIGFYLFPGLDSMKIELLKRGGILVGTGVRGGAERGYPWYLSGTGKFKANPAHDLVAIADGLVARGYTTSEKIVSTGVSAGGDNVALAAQLSPASFGLVIPVSGIHDHLGYLHLDRWGPQWLTDYLNPYDSADFNLIYARAPLELRSPADRYPQYLIVCGEQDTRVSKVHSYKLKAVLEEFNKGQTYLYCVDHAGHWPNASYTHGRQGIKTNAVIWAWVFDYLGLEF